MVVGRLRLESPTPEINCYVCRAITNFNDITHHHLSVIATHIDLIHKPVLFITTSPSPRKYSHASQFISNSISNYFFIGNTNLGVNKLTTIGSPSSGVIMNFLRAESPKSYIAILLIKNLIA